MRIKPSFAAFLMTYERPDVVPITLSKIFNQTQPPEKVLIVDNSESRDTEVLVSKMNQTTVEYLRVGYNAGPAGAAKIGLQKLANEGFDWIYWGDDDNPPDFTDSFELLLNLGISQPGKIGIVGAVGQFFNRSKGEIERVPDEDLTAMPIIGVDSIAGGQCMIVHSDIVRAGVLPQEKLFFGFEELDFCLRAQKSGFDLLVSSELFLRARAKYGKLNFKKPSYVKREFRSLIREYYSTRNMFFILIQNNLSKAFYYQLVKCFIKSIYGFKFGFKYGYQNSRMILIGAHDYFNDKFGKRF